jgi:hypothetical protein
VVYTTRRMVGVAPGSTTSRVPALILEGMRFLVSLLVGSLSLRVTRNVLRRNRRLRRLVYLPR